MATSSASVRRSGARGVGERTVRERRARRSGAASLSGEGGGRGVGVAREEGGARGGGGARRRHGSRPRAARSLPARPPATRSPAVRPPREQGKGAKGAEPVLRPKEQGGAPRSKAPRCSCGARARVPHRPHLVTPPPRIRHLGGRTSPCRRGSAAADLPLLAADPLWSHMQWPAADCVARREGTQICVPSRKVGKMGTGNGSSVGVGF